MDQLAILNEPVKSTDLQDAIIDGLGIEYHPFVHALHACCDVISFDDLFGLLLIDEIQLKRDETVSSFLSAFAYVAQKCVDNGSFSQNIATNYGQLDGHGGHNNPGNYGQCGHGRHTPSGGSFYPLVNYNI